MSPSTTESKTNVRWKLVAFVFVYTIALKILPYIFQRMGMDVTNRFEIYPWNFTPIFALCLFGGAVYQSRLNSIWIPLAAMLAGDLGIWAVTGRLDWAFYSNQWVVYCAFVLCALIGFALRNKRTWTRLGVAGVTGCLTFFLITNFSSWLTYDTYPQTFSGLIACYVAGLPFLKNSLIATAIFGGLLFSPACLLETTEAAAESEMVPATNLS